LYRLKHGLIAWYTDIDGYLQSMGFTKIWAYPNLYYIFVGTNLLILVMHVSDLFFTSVEKLIVVCKVDMVVEFEMKDIDMMHYLLGLKV